MNGGRYGSNAFRRLHEKLNLMHVKNPQDRLSLMAGALHDAKTVAKYYAVQDGESIARSAASVFESCIAPVVRTKHEDNSSSQSSHYSLLVSAINGTISQLNR
jgi:hypothetical protein